MNISVNALQTHINNLNRGLINFSDVEMNCRADLVRFEGYSLEQAAKMEESKLYSILDGMDSNLSGMNDIETECKCKTCESFLYETEYSDFDDKYTLLCKKCNVEIRIHYTVYDAWRDGIADSKKFESEACKVVKLLRKHCYVSIDNSQKFKENVRTNAQHIQTLEMEYENDEYYMLNGCYYFVGFNSGEFKPKSESDFQLFINGLVE